MTKSQASEIHIYSRGERELDSAKWRACSQAIVFQDKITSIFLLGVRYNEERLYDYDNPGFHPDVGHFTQVRLIESVYLADYYLSRNKFSFLTFNINKFFTCAIRLHRTVEILLQIAVLSAVQKLARFLGSRVNERRICTSFRAFKDLS